MPDLTTLSLTPAFAEALKPIFTAFDAEVKPGTQLDATQREAMVTSLAYKILAVARAQLHAANAKLAAGVKPTALPPWSDFQTLAGTIVARQLGPVPTDDKKPAPAAAVPAAPTPAPAAPAASAPQAPSKPAAPPTPPPAVKTTEAA